ncbi:3-oxoacyl-[acyl-carrier-protein] reductase FabG [Defluviimonas aquaemixtae]|uniref:3-oxoacyl-[acyl-carrier-protein] reductase FabG n=1 Tax=Albidovulum aquaemixtae TaxID=1542388 RepID=A0A2R8BLJ7_9RHOB|nr:SDR family NAD(P)-dependent oxidoreductase [Defluviimonas aquaemixtae]SPH24277.1 3-oxoacyl-[acyl-carrier-protein] reductase FabG [Defluviimonas aquaemixtae]
MKTVLITGVSRGLGLATARRLLADPENYRVVGTSRTLSDAYGELVEENEGRVEFLKSDLGDIDSIPALIGGVVDRHGPLWGLVNNAAIGTDGVLATMHQTDIQNVLTVNLMAPLVLVKYASRGMLAKRQGRIVSVSSIIASTGFHGLAAYAASKAGLEGMTRSLSRELGKRNITVNCVAPGYMETEMTKGLDVHKMASIRRRAPLGLAEPEDAAGAVAYLLGPEAGRLTGTVITVDGGSTA